MIYPGSAPLAEDAKQSTLTELGGCKRQTSDTRKKIKPLGKEMLSPNGIKWKCVKL